jgi:hemoglobin-like flavoprotein
MSPELIQRLEDSFEALKPQGEQLVDRFYQILFERAPQVRSFFPDDLSGQQKKLLASLAFTVANLRKPDALVEALHALGARHVNYGTTAEHYPVVRDCMIEAMSQTAGDLWNPQLAEAWMTALDFVSSVMIEGAELAQSKAA